MTSILILLAHASQLQFALEDVILFKDKITHYISTVYILMWSNLLEARIIQLYENHGYSGPNPVEETLSESKLQIPQML